MTARVAPACVAVIGVLLAAPAAAAQERLPGGRALVAEASLSPSTHLFGDAVVARVDVVVDPREFDPARLRVPLRFGPYRPAGGVRVERRESGGLVHVRYEATLRCLHVGCLAPRAQTPLGGQEEGRGERHTIALPPVEVLHGDEILLVRHFPAVQVVSRLNTAPDQGQRGYAASLEPPAPTYRARPGLLAALALAAALLLTLFPAALVLRALHARWLAARAWRPLTAHERALVLVDWTARREDGDVDRRKALEALAVVLDRRGERGLAARARGVAWTEQPPPGARAEELGTEARRALNGGGDGRLA